MICHIIPTLWPFKVTLLVPNSTMAFKQFLRVILADVDYGSCTFHCNGTSCLYQHCKSTIYLSYGRIVDIDLKIPLRPPGYAFVEFEDPHHAEYAIHGQDCYNFDGNRLRVELAHGGRGHSSSISNSYGGGGCRGGVSKHSE